MSNKDQFLNNKNQRILFILFAIGMLYLCSYLINPYAKFWKSYFTRPLEEIGIEWLLTIIFCSLISEASILINQFFNQYLSWTENAFKRLVLQTSVTIISATSIMAMQFFAMYWFEGSSKAELNQEDFIGLWQWFIISIIISLMISSVNTLNYLISNWKITAVAAAEYELAAAEFKQAAAEAELQALKLQVDPHFVFNNLSVLSEIILEDQKLGYQYAENFSKVYRYLLLHSKKDVITLEDELKFAHSYIFLLQNRIGNGVEFEIDIDKAFYHYYLPPMTMQILIENAIKHNKTLKTSPLKIKISINDADELVISNSLAPLDHKAHSSGIGLANIIKRYKLLDDKMPEIIQNLHHFIVEIPLLKYEKKHTDY